MLIRLAYLFFIYWIAKNEGKKEGILWFSDNCLIRKTSLNSASSFIYFFFCVSHRSFSCFSYISFFLHIFIHFRFLWISIVWSSIFSSRQLPSIYKAKLHIHLRLFQVFIVWSSMLILPPFPSIYKIKYAEPVTLAENKLINN